MIFFGGAASLINSQNVKIKFGKQKAFVTNRCYRHVCIPAYKTMDNNIQIKNNIERLLAEAVETGDIISSAEESLKKIMQAVPDAVTLSVDDWKEIELYFPILLSERIINFGKPNAISFS
jgi:hypothetical protein